MLKTNLAHTGFDSLLRSFSNTTVEYKIKRTLAAWGTKAERAERDDHALCCWRLKGVFSSEKTSVFVLPKNMLWKLRTILKGVVKKACFEILTSLKGHNDLRNIWFKGNTFDSQVGLFWKPCLEEKKNFSWDLDLVQKCLTSWKIFHHNHEYKRQGEEMCWPKLVLAL